jgi:hypothetical protein
MKNSECSAASECRPALGITSISGSGRAATMSPRMVESFLVLQHAVGGECLEDMSHLRGDPWLKEMLGYEIPSPEAAYGCCASSMRPRRQSRPNNSGSRSWLSGAGESGLGAGVGETLSGAVYRYVIRMPLLSKAINSRHSRPMKASVATSLC